MLHVVICTITVSLLATRTTCTLLTKALEGDCNC